MPRPCHCRRIESAPQYLHFTPIAATRKEPCPLPLDCLEALRLADCLGLPTESASARMGVSRHTFGRLLRKARHITAEAICNGRPLIIEAIAYSINHSPTGEKEMSRPTLVAVPSESDGGLNAKPSAHFGHCQAYTLAKVEDGRIEDVRSIPNPGHAEGGCLKPVEILARDGVQALLAGGMGMRPLTAMQEAGIAVYYSPGFNTVQEALEAFAQGKLQPFGSEQMCKGCHGHHVEEHPHHHDHHHDDRH